MTILMGLLLALVPLSIAPGWLFYFDVTPKIVILLLGTAVAFPWFIMRSGRKGQIRSGQFAVLIAVLWASLLLSTIASSNPVLSLGGTSWRRLGLVTWTAILALSYIAYAHFQDKPREIQTVLRAVVVSGAGVSLYGIFQFFGWDPWLPREAYHIGEDFWTIVRPPGTLGYVTYFAAYLLSVVFFGVALWLVESSITWKIAGLATTSLAAVAIILSGTRAAMLGLLAGAVLLALWLRPRLRIARAAAIALILMAASSAFYMSPMGQRLRSRTRWYVEDPLGGPRLWLWRDALRMGATHWLHGSGPETFSTEFPRFQSVELSRKAPDFYHESPHNFFVDALTSQGVAGLAILLLLAVSAVCAARRASVEHPRLTAALGAALAASVVAHQFGCLTAPTALFLFINMALLFALDTGSPTLQGNMPRGILAGLCFIITAGLTMFAVRLLAADRLLAVTDSAFRAGDVRAAFASYERAIRWGPPGMSADIWYSRRAAVAARAVPDIRLRWEAWNRAFAAGSRATQVSEDRHNAWYNLAMLAASRDDPAATERNLRSAIDAAPRWYKPHWMLAETLRVTGRLDEAAMEAALACDLNGGRNAEVARTRDTIHSQRTRH